MDEIIDSIESAIDGIIAMGMGLYDTVCAIFDHITDISSRIALIIEMPATALDTFFTFDKYFPDTFWYFLSTFLWILLGFRVLKIVLSGG